MYEPLEPVAVVYDAERGSLPIEVQIDPADGSIWLIQHDDPKEEYRDTILINPSLVKPLIQALRKAVRKAQSM